MIKKIVLGALFGFLISAATYAQNAGVDYYNAGELDQAKSIFETQLTQNPAEANYYLGEIAYAQGDLTKAQSYYQQGGAANPDYLLNNVGLAKLLLKTDAKAAEKAFNDIQKKDKKNVEVIVAIAKAYYQNGLTVKGDSKMEDARKANSESPYIYVLEGDMLKEAGKTGEAAASYDQAIHFAPDYTAPYIKIAQIYAQVNPTVAIDRLNKVLEINPDFKLANKYLAETYYRSGQYVKAIDVYKVFFAEGNYDMNDLTHYAASLFFNNNFDEAEKLISEGIQKDPNNFVLNRLLMYSAVELKDYANGLPIADKFFSLKRGANDIYIARDYISYGKLLIENNQFDKALVQYDEAISLDSTQYQLYKEISTSFADSEKNIEAATFLQKYIDKAGENAIAMDFYNMGRYYYYAAGIALKDTLDPESPAKTKAYLAAADTAFATVATRVPDNHLGSFWRARANSLLDNIAFTESNTRPVLAKPHYEAAAAILMTKEGSEANLIECYRYLSSYYYLAFDETKSEEDKAMAIEYCGKLLELDPANTQAQQIIEALK